MKKLTDLNFEEVNIIKEAIEKHKAGYSLESCIDFKDGLRVLFARDDLDSFAEGIYFNFDMSYDEFKDLIRNLNKTDNFRVFSLKHKDISIKLNLYGNEFYRKNGILSKDFKLNKNDKIISITY